MKKNNGFHVLVQGTIAVTALLALIGAVILHSIPSKSTAGTVLIVMTVICILLLLLELWGFNTQNKKIVSRLATMITRTERDSMYNFPAPTIVINDVNVVVWANRQFSERLYTDGEAYGHYLQDMMNIDLDQIHTTKGDLVCVNTRFYYAKAVENEADRNLTLIYFDDVTDFIELDYENRMSHRAVIIIMIDNYDDIMSGVRESEKAHVQVEIEKLIEDFIEGSTAISKKLSNDRFYIFMEERHLAPIIEDRFRILEQARKITVSDRSNITLSIGVSRDGVNPAESEKFARQALEMCMGRGGDQAAVKENGEFNFFGGLSSGTDTNNKTRIRMVAKAIAEYIDTHERVLVMGHRFGDLDSIGSSMGIVNAARQMGKPAYLVVDRTKNLAVSLIDYLEQHEADNIFITPKQALSLIDDSTLLFVCDTHNPALVESAEIVERARDIIVIDHHRRMVDGIQPTVMSFLEPNASSACELVTMLVQYFGEDVNMSAPVAEALLSGIMLDTKNFVMKTGVMTFEAAALLKKYGADTVAVKKLFANSIETYHQKSALINNAAIYNGCAIAYTEETFPEIRIAASQAADELLGITGVNASFVLYQLGDTVNISARSMGAFNVQIVMEALGGGGHLTMAATQIKTTLEDARNRLNAAIDEYIRNNTQHD
jgi:c-di-AMP phosphodiesterase-like protein